MTILNRSVFVTLALLTANQILPAAACPTAPGLSQQAVSKSVPRRPDVPRKCIPKKPCPRASGAAGND